MLFRSNRDMKLLLDLLANSSGVATALAVLSVLDKVTFNDETKPDRLKFNKSKIYIVDIS